MTNDVQWSHTNEAASEDNFTRAADLLVLTLVNCQKGHTPPGVFFCQTRTNQWRRQGGASRGTGPGCKTLCPGSWATVTLTINESVDSEQQIILKTLTTMLSIMLSSFVAIYYRCLATRSSAVAERPHDASLSHSMVIENGTIHRSHTSSFVFHS